MGSCGTRKRVERRLDQSVAGYHRFDDHLGQYRVIILRSSRYLGTRKALHAITNPSYFLSRGIGGELQEGVVPRPSLRPPLIQGDSPGHGGPGIGPTRRASGALRDPQADRRARHACTRSRSWAKSETAHSVRPAVRLVLRGLIMGDCRAPEEPFSHRA